MKTFEILGRLSLKKSKFIKKSINAPNEIKIMLGADKRCKLHVLTQEKNLGGKKGGANLKNHFRTPYIFVLLRTGPS